MQPRSQAKAATVDRRVPLLAGFALLALGAVLTAWPAHAGTFAPPEGCTGFMTVQSRLCRVSNHYRCTADAPGDQWRADFDQEGIYFLTHIDREAQWIESAELPEMVRQTLDPDPADPASFSELLADGRDDYRFGLSKDDGTASRVEGFDRLTGQSTVIDGVPLEMTEFDFTELTPEGSVIRRARGQEYIGRDMRLFFAGPGDIDAGDGEWLPIDGSPMQFIFPGEPGFMASQPLFDCDAVQAMAAP